MEKQQIELELYHYASARKQTIKQNDNTINQLQQELACYYNNANNKKQKRYE